MKLLLLSGIALLFIVAILAGSAQISGWYLNGCGVYREILEDEKSLEQLRALVYKLYPESKFNPLTENHIHSNGLVEFYINNNDFDLSFLPQFGVGMKLGVLMRYPWDGEKKIEAVYLGRGTRSGLYYFLDDNPSRVWRDVKEKHGAKTFILQCNGEV